MVYPNKYIFKKYQKTSNIHFTLYGTESKFCIIDFIILSSVWEISENFITDGLTWTQHSFTSLWLDFLPLWK